MNEIITVLMSTYNGEKYLAEQIDSILKQKDCQVRLIVRDDGSNDATIDILKQYQEKGELEWYAGTNMGPAKSFLELVKNSPASSYYAFSDQDDVWDDDKLSIGITALKKADKPSLYCSNVRVTDENLHLIKDKAFPDKINIDFSSVITDSGNLFGCTMVFNEAMKNYISVRDVPEDIIMHDIWLGCIAALFGNLVYDSQPHFSYRNHTESFTVRQNTVRKGMSALEKILYGNRISDSCQCVAFTQYAGRQELTDQGAYEICCVLNEYRKSLPKRLKLLKIVLNKDDISKKQRILKLLQIVMNKY